MFRDLQNPLIFWLRRLSTRCSLVISSMCFPHVRDSTMCTPRILLLGARSTGSFSMKMCGSSGRALILALKPITKYSVLAMLRLSLFAASHFLILTRSWFNFTSISLNDFPATVMLMSSSKSLGVASGSKQLGISFIYIKNKMGPRIDRCGTPQSIFLSWEDIPFTWQFSYDLLNKSSAGEAHFLWRHKPW